MTENGKGEVHGTEATFDIMDVVQGMMSNALGQGDIFGSAELEDVDIVKYFDENTLKDRKLSDDDMITVSLKEKDGYRAVFVKLGDLRKYILGS